VNPLGDLSGAIAGWTDVVAGKPEAKTSFRTDSSGLMAAVVTVIVAALLAAAVQSAASGVPSLLQALLGLLAWAVMIGFVAYTMSRALRSLAPDVTPNALLVPILYAFAFVIVLSIPLDLFNATLIALLVLALMIWRAAQVLGGMTTGVSLAFAALCLIVLVVVSIALYMLLSFIPSA